MSNQNFDTNDPFSSTSQPIPIAKQLEAQAYLSQVQNQRKDIASENEDVSASLPQLPSRFSIPPAPVEEPPQRENKMDAFFRQAEEEERQRIEAAQNPTGQTPEQTIDESSSEPVADFQQAQPVQQYDTPVVDLPQVDMTVETFAVPQEMTVPTEEPQRQQPEQEVNAEFSPAPQTSSSFSAGSFSAPSMDQNSNSDSSSPFSTQQFTPVEPTPSVPLADEEQNNFQQAPISQPQNDAIAPDEDPKPSQETDKPVARRLTGAAGLSAGLALAGMGGLGAFKANASTPQSAAPVEPQPRRQPLTTDVPVQPQDQPLANSQQPTPADFGITMPTVDEGSGDADSGATVANQPNDNSFDPSAANIYAPGSVQPPQNFVAQTDQSQTVSSTPQQIPPAVTGGFSSGFNSFGQTPMASAGNGAGSDVRSGPAPTSSEEPSHMTPAAPQVESVQTQPQQPSASDQGGDNEVVDMRLAAEQQAQRIKAERARALVDGPDVVARPYGADRQRAEDTDHQHSVLENLVSSDEDQVSGVSPQQPSPAQETPVDFQPSQAMIENPAPLDANQVPTVDPQQQTHVQEAPVDSQLSQASVEEPSGEVGNAGGGFKHRPFPMDLFNQKLLKNLRSGVVYVDHKRRVQLWSKGAETMTGIVSDTVIERPLYPQTFNLRFEDGSGVPVEQCPIAKSLETMETITADYRTLNADNQEVKIEVAITPVVDEHRYVNGAIIIFNDHTAEIDLQNQLKDLYEFSVLDPLTQVANRAEFERVLEEYVRAFNQSESFNCSIIICDIDFFKSINDNFGHAIGDQALVAFSEMLRKYVRSQDLVARYGGEEFVILCADCDTDSALQRAEQIRMGLFKTPQKMLGGKSISASFGVSELRTGDTAMEFFVRADTALLKAKELGRNRVVIADQREADRHVNISDDGSLSGMQWRQQRREHTALICEEFKTSTPIPVLVEKLRGFIVEKDAWLQRVDQEFLSMEVDFEAPNDYSRKGSFTLNIEFKEGDDNEGGRTNKNTFIRVTIFPGRKKKWFSTNHTDVAPHLLSDLRSYLMINDEASHITIEMATEDVRAG